jgi:hypothetical protein
MLMGLEAVAILNLDWTATECPILDRWGRATQL